MAESPKPSPTGPDHVEQEFAESCDKLTLLVTAGLDWVRRDGGEWLAGRRLSDRVLGACSRSGAASVTLQPSRGSRRRSGVFYGALYSCVPNAAISTFPLYSQSSLDSA
jgi:hypothetical protein